MSEITAHHGIFKDTNLHVDDTGGAGRPVILIHGWPLSGEAFKGNVPAIEAAGYRVITYDRRGFGRSDKPKHGYTYDTLAEDLHTLITELDLQDVTILGFSMGGGEVARYIKNYGTERLHSAVFASSVPPYMLQTGDNPDGPLTKEAAASMTAGLTKDEQSFYDGFCTDFFTANGVLKVTEAQRHEAVELTKQASKVAALACMAAFGTTDFRQDLEAVNIPALILHGDADGTVPFAGSGERTHKAIPGSELHVIAGAPHGANVSDEAEWNQAVVEFLAR